MRLKILLLNLFFLQALNSCFALHSGSAQDQLNKAIINDSEQQINDSIKAGAQINFSNINQSPLLKAILLKKKNAVRVLLSYGINPNIIYLNKPIVHWAIKNGELEISTMLINAGADFTGTIEGGQDAFTYVAINFNKPIPGKSTQVDLDLLYTMVNHGYNIKKNFTNKNLANNAWYLVIINNKKNHIGYFLGWDGKFSQNPYPLLQAANPNETFVLSNNSTCTPLMLAIKYLQEHAKESDAGDAFNSILQYGKVDLNQKAKPNEEKTQSALSYLLEINPQSYNFPIGYLIDALIKKGANVKEALQLFIENGHSPNYIIKDQRFGKWTLLGLAVFYNSPDAVEFLLSIGADVNKLTNSSVYVTPHIKGIHTPLYFALQLGNSEIEELLLMNGGTV